jgi:adenylate cyclase
MAEERLQRRLAAILAADVVGYSRLMEQDEAGTLTRLKTLRKEVFDPKTEQFGGRIFKNTGDGALAEFGSAVDAVQCAVDVQRALAQRNADLPEDLRITLRIGISLGDVIVEGNDLFGNGVNVAARMEGLAEPGGICISGNVHEHVRSAMDLGFDDLGELEVKNIERPVHAYGIMVSGQDPASSPSLAIDEVLRRPAVAVLPFENLSADPEQDYFADGLTEDIITALSLWRLFPVIARNSTFAYKGQSPDIRKVGEELGVRYVIEGSVRKAANRIRVTSQLINAETGHHVWAERFDRELQDIFELQDEITGKIAAVIAPELVKAESERSVMKRPENLDAWDYCQRGKFLMNEISKPGVIAARELFEQAVALDPNFVDAWCGIAHTYFRELSAGFSEEPDEARIKLLEAARRAVELDDANAAAHYHLCYAYMYKRRLAEALAEGERAVELNPVDPISHNRLGQILILAGRPEEGLHYLETAVRLNARHPRIYIYRANLARAYLDAHQYEEAADQARQAVHRGGVFLDGHLILASALGHLGRADEAMAVLDDIETSRGLRIGDVVLSPFWQLYKDTGPNEHLFDGLRKAGLLE